jgi:Acyclic terpene utilisation family protein AtuA
MDTLRIGNGCGFWGDNLDAPIFLAEQGRLDYLTLEYLAELTMSILAIQKRKHPTAGYATDFLDVLGRLVPTLRKQPTLRIVTNAGGMNPHGCGEAARDLLGHAGLDRKIAVVDGDDLFPRLDELLAAGETFANLDNGRSLSEIRERVVSANAYLGARPIADALALGADIVITGRVADASLTVGPAAHHFGWSWDDAHRLGLATVAGHLIECGAQATGGLYTRWQDVPDLANVGYPLVEMSADGTFVLTKPDGTGGLVNQATAAEQLLYEVGDSAAYLTPDVVADFTQVRLEDAGPNRVRIADAGGRPATNTYKVSLAYRAGFASSGTLVIAGPDAAAKAELAGSMLVERLRRIGGLPARHLVERLGTGDVTPDVLPHVDPPEVVLRVAVHDGRREIVERFTKEFAPLVTSGPPGVTGYTTGRPNVREVFAYWPTLVSKERVIPRVSLLP